mmetsp:Transcript_37915/g.112250  ORF Transcript_37915/g.112250 Transcript_37915/m.112250 type:complete len:288 (-) Transcript_37915:85-948(-)
MQLLPDGAGLLPCRAPAYSTSSFPPQSAASVLWSLSSGTSPLSRACDTCTSHGSSNRMRISVVPLAVSVSSSIVADAFSSAASRSSSCLRSARSSSLCFSIRSCRLRTSSSSVSLSLSSSLASSSFFSLILLSACSLRISSKWRAISASRRSIYCCIESSFSSSALICSFLCSHMSLKSSVAFPSRLLKALSSSFRRSLSDRICRNLSITNACSTCMSFFARSKLRSSWCTRSTSPVPAFFLSSFLGGILQRADGRRCDQPRRGRRACRCRAHRLRTNTWTALLWWD